MSFADAIILGVVQGITEFLPISSSGHLILAREFFGFSPEGGLAFDAVLQLATAFAIVLSFRSDLLALCTRNLFRSDSEEARLVRALLIATVPAVGAGLWLEPYMETTLRSIEVVLGALVFGALLMAGAEWRARANALGPQVLSGSAALAVGFFQMLALVPGMSRSGMTMVGAQSLGLSREAAAKFAFLLGIPILMGSGLKKLIDIFSGESAGATLPVLFVGGVTSFLVGFLVVYYLLRYLRTHSLMLFVWYRLVLAALGYVLLAS